VHGETERETVLYNKQFDKLLHDVSCGRTHSHLGLGCGRKGIKKENGRLAMEWV